MDAVGLGNAPRDILELILSPCAISVESLVSMMMSCKYLYEVLPSVVANCYWPEHNIYAIDNVARLFPRLTTATFYDDKCMNKFNTFKNLPPSLTKLQFTKCDTLPMNVIKKLPTGLKVLILPNASSPSDAGIRVMPAGLETLYLKANVRISAVGLANMPKNLTCLKIRSNKITGSSFAKLPRSLRILDFSAYNLDAQYLVDLPDLEKLVIRRARNMQGCIELLPASLKSFKTVECKGFNASDFHELPAGLEKLVWDSHYVPASMENITGVPPALKTLDIRSVCSWNAEILQLLPDTLTKLAIKSSDYSTSLEGLERLVNLTSLFLKGPKMSHINPDNFPRSLRLVNIVGSVKLAKAVTKSLPNCRVIGI